MGSATKTEVVAPRRTASVVGLPLPLPLPLLCGVPKSLQVPCNAGDGPLRLFVYLLLDRSICMSVRARDDDDADEICAAALQADQRGCVRLGGRQTLVSRMLVCFLSRWPSEFATVRRRNEMRFSERWVLGGANKMT